MLLRPGGSAQRLRDRKRAATLPASTLAASIVHGLLPGPSYSIRSGLASATDACDADAATSGGMLLPGAAEGLDSAMRRPGSAMVKIPILAIATGTATTLPRGRVQSDSRGLRMEMLA